MVVPARYNPHSPNEHCPSWENALHAATQTLACKQWHSSWPTLEMPIPGSPRTRCLKSMSGQLFRNTWQQSDIGTVTAMINTWDPGLPSYAQTSSSHSLTIATLIVQWTRRQNPMCHSKTRSCNLRSMDSEHRRPLALSTTIPHCQYPPQPRRT